MDGAEPSGKFFKKVDLRQRFAARESDATLITRVEIAALEQLRCERFRGDAPSAQAAAALIK